MFLIHQTVPPHPYIGSLLYPHYPPTKDSLEVYAAVAVDEEESEEEQGESGGRRNMPPLMPMRSMDTIGGIVHRALGGDEEGGE
ncbi:hypothetical protein EON65_42570, partial [archaeon]